MHASTHGMSLNLPQLFTCPVCTRTMERATMHAGLVIYICQECGATLSVPTKSPFRQQ